MADENVEQAAEVDVPEAQEGGKPKSGIMLVVIIGVVIAVVTPLITFFVVKATIPAPIQKEKPVDVAEQTTFELKEMYVNIAETKGTRVLKIEPILVLSDAKLASKLEKMAPMLRDRVLMAASTKTIDELDGPNGKESLKREIISMINNSIKDQMSGAVTDVYFNQFLIQ